MFNKNSKFWKASGSKLQPLLICPLSKQEKENISFEELRFSKKNITNKMAKFGVIVVKKFESV